MSSGMAGRKVVLDSSCSNICDKRYRYKDMRNNSFKQLREKLRESSRFFLGSNKVLQVALGRESSDEVRENMHLLTEHIKGHVGLLFTELSKEEVHFI